MHLVSPNQPGMVLSPKDSDWSRIFWHFHFSVRNQGLLFIMHLSGVSTVAVGAFGFISSPRIRYDKWFSTKFCSNAGLMEHAFKCAGTYKCYYRCDELRITVRCDGKRKQAQGLAKFMWRTVGTRKLTWKGTAGGCRAAERLGETDESWVSICELAGRKRAS